MRLTKIDIANIKKATSVKIFNRSNEERDLDYYSFELNERLRLSPTYSTLSSARRALKRHTDLEPTTL